MSHPMWVCGLKLCKQHNQLEEHQVAPYVGVWIETICIVVKSETSYVAPYVGVWIETCYIQ